MDAKEAVHKVADLIVEHGLMSTRQEAEFVRQVEAVVNKLDTDAYWRGYREYQDATRIEISRRFLSLLLPEGDDLSRRLERLEEGQHFHDEPL